MKYLIILCILLFFLSLILLIINLSLRNVIVKSRPLLPKRRYNKPLLTAKELSDALYITNEKLRESNEKLLETEYCRSEMFANISHDLRSPITAIRSSIEYLNSVETFEKSELNYLLKLMNTRIISLENLINDIFLLTTLNNKAIELNFSNIELGMFLEDYFYSNEADKKYAERILELEVPEEFLIPVQIDTGNITRVLDNLFTNALKYSDSGSSIVLGAFVNEDQVHIFVKDSGMGISEKNIEKIFDRSYMVSSSRSSGCGLGLSIAKAIVERHEGNIWCESTLGGGSTFTFTLPIIHLQSNKEVL
jgi:signal transduction histidine kinase